MGAPKGRGTPGAARPVLARRCECGHPLPDLVWEWPSAVSNPSRHFPCLPQGFKCGDHRPKQKVLQSLTP